MATLLIIGEVGNGKSSLGNQLLGYNAFSVNGDVNPETKVIIGKKRNQDNLFVIDTPGISNLVENKNTAFQLIDYLKQIKRLNAILLVFNYQQVRITANFRTLIQLLYTIFPKKNIGKHIAFVLTNSFTKIGAVTSEQKITKINKIFPEFKKIMEEESDFIFEKGIFGFVDIDPDEGVDSNGKLDLERIIEWASSLDNLFDVKDITNYEFQLLKDENKKLKEEIEKIKIDIIIKEKKYEKQFDNLKNEISLLKKNK